MTLDDENGVFESQPQQSYVASLQSTLPYARKRKVSEYEEHEDEPRGQDLRGRIVVGQCLGSGIHHRQDRHKDDDPHNAALITAHVCAPAGLLLS